MRANIAAVNPRAAIVEARSSLALEGGKIRGRTRLVVEDGPTLTHGGMTYGAASSRRSASARPNRRSPALRDRGAQRHLH